MAPTALCVVLLLFLASHCQAQDLASYENSKILISGQYELYWTYRAADSRMDMAVRVKTLGWFGLGISLDGQMSNSDVVTGWVTAGGTAMLQVSECKYWDGHIYKYRNCLHTFAAFTQCSATGPLRRCEISTPRGHPAGLDYGFREGGERMDHYGLQSSSPDW